MTKQKKIMALLVCGLILIILGLSLAVLSIEGELVSRTPRKDIGDLEPGETARIEGEIEADSKNVIWWEEVRGANNQESTELDYISQFEVSDDTASIKVDMSRIKSVRPGRHDVSYKNYKNSYLDGDTIGIVGEVSNDGNRIYAHYVAKDADDFNSQSRGTLLVGGILFFVGLISLCVYLLINRKKGFQIVIDMNKFGSGLPILGIILILFDIFMFKKRFFLFGGIILCIIGLISIVMQRIRKSMKTKESEKEIQEIVALKGMTSRETYYSICKECQAVLEYTLTETGFEAPCKRCDYKGRLPHQCMRCHIDFEFIKTEWGWEGSCGKCKMVRGFPWF